jgi:hypothetical protein
MKKNAWILGAMAMTAAAACACSSTSSSSGSAGPTACTTSGFDSNGNAACGTCVESACASQVSMFQSACSDFQSCACPGGTFNPADEKSCESKLTESGCSSALSVLDSCQQQHCTAKCTGGPFDAGDGG